MIRIIIPRLSCAIVGFSCLFSAPVFGAQSPPVISSIQNQITFPGVAVVGIPFTVSDAQTPAADLVLSVTSGNPTIVPESNIVFGGSGTNRTVTLTPLQGARGQSLITITVTDQHDDSASTAFLLKAADFTPVTPPFAQLAMGKVSWADYDNDGDLDALLSGMNAPNTAYTALCRNDGGGSFVSVYHPFPQLEYTASDWADYDNDGRLDLLIAGSYSGNYNGTSQIFRNNGSGMFTYVAALPYVHFGSVGWGDLDNDGDLDALLGGRYDMYAFRNTSGTFTNLSLGFPGGWYNYTAWADYDNDGDLDWATAASSSGGTRIFRQDGAHSLLFHERPLHDRLPMRCLGRLRQRRRPRPARNGYRRHSTLQKRWQRRLLRAAHLPSGRLLQRHRLGRLR